MPRAVDVGMRQLVHQYQVGIPLQGGIQMKFRQLMSKIVDMLAWQHSQSREQFFSFAAAVGFDDAHYHVNRLAAKLLGRR